MIFVLGFKDYSFKLFSIENHSMRRNAKANLRRISLQPGDKASPIKEK